MTMMRSTCDMSFLSFLKVAIRALGFEIKKTQVQKIIKDYDRNDQGKITYQDFYEISKTTRLEK